MQMKIVQAHNYYQQHGGEDTVFESEAALLATYGHTIIQYSRNNSEIGSAGSLSLALNTVWSRASYRAIRILLQRERPDVLHVHNTLPLISPAVFHAAHAENTPVVLTLHNYRLLCPSGLLLREGKICEQCAGRSLAWPGVFHACYRDSTAASAAVATLLTTHRLLGTWTSRVDTYIALTEFARNKFIEGGLPASRIVVKPNFHFPDPVQGEHRGGYGLFAGRLSREKGLHTLLSAWKSVRGSLKIVGAGPDASLLSRCTNERVLILGMQQKDRVLALMQNADYLVFPSLWYEGFPLTIVEAFATGLPVIASRLGSAAEIVDDGRTGLHFDPGDADDLAAKVNWAIDHPEEMRVMGFQARAEYELKYTASKNYEMLISIYENAIEEKRSIGVAVRK
jgi:glycosyltransferase involved in cell wall biosynthesis